MQGKRARDQTRDIQLAVWENARLLIVKHFPVHCVHRHLPNYATCYVSTRFLRLTE